MLLDTLLGELAGPISPQQRDLLERAKNRCRGSITAAQRLLTVAQILEKPEFFQGSANLAALARQSVERYAPLASRRNIATALVLETDIFWARGYEPVWAEGLDILIQNALKYTPDHGRIRITIAGHQDQVRIIISDSGIGIAPKDQEHLFEPFFRSSDARNSSREGTGLGLTFIKAIVEAAGGTITAGRSDLGGAEFTLTLPRVHPAALEEASGERFRVIIVGGVAAGPKVAARVVRLKPHAEVTVIEKGTLLSYAGCGLPFYISGIVKNQSELMSSPAGILRDPVFFQQVKNVKVMNQTQALEIDRARKRIRVRESAAPGDEWLAYDKLVLATGAEPIIPEIPGINLQNVFSLHGVADAEGVRAALENSRARDVVILGGGLIGIEITEALVRKGCRVTIVEMRSQIMRLLDEEMARLLESHLESQGVKILTNTNVLALEGDSRVSAVRTDKGALATDLVILAIGVHPNVALARAAALDLGVTGGIRINEYLQTSDPDIYAAGDCTETVHLLTGQPCYIPLGSTANRQGRVVANNICGQSDTFPGILGSIACKAFDFSVALTGLTELAARRLGYQVMTALVPGPDREHFVPGAKVLFLKLVADADSRRLLGLQAVGPGNADKRVDVAALALANRLTVDQLANMDLCYAPQFAPVMDNLITAVNVARNKLDGIVRGISPREVSEKLRNGSDLILLDVRTHLEVQQKHLPRSIHIPLGSLRERNAELPRDRQIVTICNYGLRGYEASLILQAAGFQKVFMLDGGLEMWPHEQLLSSRV